MNERHRQYDMCFNDLGLPLGELPIFGYFVTRKITSFIQDSSLTLIKCRKRIIHRYWLVRCVLCRREKSQASRYLGCEGLPWLGGGPARDRLIFVSSFIQATTAAATDAGWLARRTFRRIVIRENVSHGRRIAMIECNRCCLYETSAVVWLPCLYRTTRTIFDGILTLKCQWAPNDSIALSFQSFILTDLNMHSAI